LETLDGYLVMEDAEIEASDLMWLLCSEPLIVAGMPLASSELSGRVTWGTVSLHFVIANAARLDELLSAASGSRLTADEWTAWQTDAGIPQHGLDYGEGDNPHAASLERRTVDWSKGCYLGQEVVCMQDMRGKVRRRLAALSPVGLALPKSGDSVLDDAGKEVGTVTSVGSVHAIARLLAPAFEEGTKLKAGEADCLVAQLA
jgi:folate-binding protein YgfZ